MRTILPTFVMGLILLAGAAQAEPGDRLRTPRSNTEIQKPTTPRPPGNPCAQFGLGFARIEGSDTCIQIGGSVGIGAGGRVR